MMINKRLINFCSESKKYVFLTAFVNWIAAICNLFIVFVIGGIINTVYSSLVQNNGGGLESNFLNIYGDKLLKGIIIIVFLLGIRVISNLFYGYFSHKASIEVKTKLREAIYSKLLRLGLNYTDVISTSSAVQLSVEGVEALEVYFGRYLPQLFYALLAPVTLFIAISFISVKAGVVFILCVPLIPLSIIAIMKIAKKILKNYWSTYNNLGDTFLENLQGLTTLKVFDVDEEKHKSMNEGAEKFRKITMKVLSMQLNSINIMDLIAFGGAAVGSIIAIVEFKNGAINLGQCIVILLLSSEFFIPLRLLGSFFHIAMNGMAACDKIFALLDAEERAEKRFVIDNENQIGITLKDISFGYDKERKILKNISMDIKPKSFTAIVGESGSGKSTIASTILNSYEVDKGTIEIEGKNINDISFDSIYENINIISTNSYIFNGTILDNLLVGKENATDKEIENALELSNLTEFIATLDKGINTETGEGGALLSGGQKQRVALARAILSGRELMIFDEATSNIDVESEELIWKSINDLAKTKTIVVISHRLANVRNADNIYVLDKGEIVENGTHEKLLENKSTYFKMIKSQENLELGGVI